MKRKGNGKFFVVLLAALFCFERLIRFCLAEGGQNINHRIVWGMINLPYWSGLVLGLGILWVYLVKVKQGKTTRSLVGISSLLGILTGLLLNMIDWLNYGGVWDYLVIRQLYFNLADVYIVTGLVSLLWSNVMHGKKLNDTL